MKKVLLFLWTLPQSLLGFLLSLLCKKRILYGKNVYVWCFSGAVSLGLYIFVSKKALDTKKYPVYSEFVVAHEYGHYKQSLLLGPLYLIIIGLPSFIWATLHSTGLFNKYLYYDFYTEKWANKNAGWRVYANKDGYYVYEKICGEVNK